MPRETVIQPYVKTVERKVTTLVPIHVPGDSTLLRAVFECDSLNRVLLKDLAEVKGGKVGSAFGFKNGVLDYRADFKPDTAYLPSDTVFTEKEVPVQVEAKRWSTGKRHFKISSRGLAVSLLLFSPSGAAGNY